ncbi:protein adenylyltransferase SelO [Thiohalomonas denitrificans]|uniref:Protein nucleotidyltransferase YdiU n=1 Tax=Thiohalomonas denitrificans TaxID=415747 RepID=A0A1G5Q3K9_9GAMM|nr:YdiU family protein [Thiohalomonas denitrificans]SCZ56136.1 hypothetical protein SAMN03097708_01281 [Thiohalomonas denitrificans]
MLSVMHTLDTLPFDNSYARLPDGFYSRQVPMPLEKPRLAAFNPDVATLLGLDPEEALRPGFIGTLNSEYPLAGSQPIAMLYSGHQFGHYVPQLGDGRAVLLGEVIDPRGARWDLHLKGAGETPYSRSGDGRAVLRSTIREYLCGEAMHGLGIPTTRALCLLDSAESVYREKVERGALLLRVAPSHLRFGSFEVFYYRSQFHHLERLADYAIHHHFPHLQEESDRVTALFREVTERTARLMAQWQLVGFAHGVMNTDNMSLLGLTLDYGPFGFLDAYEPGFVCNHSDHSGRYAFDRQPKIGQWNLSCLGQALLPLMAGEPGEAAEKANAVLEEYDGDFAAHYAAGMRRKLGLRDERPEDGALATDLLKLMADTGADYTNTFRTLAHFDSRADARNDRLRDLFVDREAFDTWAMRYRHRLQIEDSRDSERAVRMNGTNPRYILRNYLAQNAIEKAEQNRDYSEIEALQMLLKDPFTERPGMESYTEEPPEWGQRLAISCSS